MTAATHIMDARSEANLAHVHPDLCRVIRQAAQSVPFLVIHGIRTQAEEAAMVAKGASQTMHSRHLAGQAGLGCAVDVAALTDGHIDWSAPAYSVIWTAVQKAAAGLNIPVEWGGVWKMRDLGHFQLPWHDYP